MPRATKRSTPKVNTTRSSAAKAKASKATPKQEAETRRQRDLLNDRITALRQTLKFKQFLGASFEPVVSDAEIIVCFADVRGFTAYCHALQREMQDRKIQNFLRRYVTIFNEGLIQWYVKHIDEKYDTPDENHLKIADYMVPSMYKNLGDGLMIVWEIPSALDFSAQGNLSQQIVFAVDTICERFYYHFRKLLPVELDSYSKRVLDLEFGVGVAKGHAWRLDYGHSIDYAGSIINLASRLEDSARPSGIVAQYDVSPWLFNELSGKDEGGVVDIEGIKGYGTVRAWISSDVDPKQESFKTTTPANKAMDSDKE